MMRQHRVKRDLYFPSRKMTAFFACWKMTFFWSFVGIVDTYSSVNMGLSSRSGFVLLDKLLSSDLGDERDTENKLGTWISENPLVSETQTRAASPEHQTVASTAPTQPGPLHRMFEEWFWKVEASAEQRGATLVPMLMGAGDCPVACQTGPSAQSTLQWRLRSGTGFVPSTYSHSWGI